MGANASKPPAARAVLAGSYTIYGGLRSVACTDLLQFVVMMLGGLTALMHTAPEKFKIAYPITDPDYPWLGVWTLFHSVGIRSPKMAALPDTERQRNGGFRNLFLWWAIFAGLVVALYAYLFYFQFLGPAKGL